ncbi:unnamed protein product [marine sediment metagenome]|uniref:Uncharacterized protein n=1 Tax=marine sediment metagenome TaxID=412755 RepID=X1VM24_9ZZZZ
MTNQLLGALNAKEFIDLKKDNGTPISKEEAISLFKKNKENKSKFSEDLGKYKISKN